MLTQKEKEKIIQQARIHPSDTGSTEVQLGLVSEEIDQLTSHLKKHKKDFDSKRALLRLVAKRRILFSYLKREDPKRYETLVKKTGVAK
ncbi:MAG: 30S ribosomal protein S15 [Candidatus Wildermuthbacteria bacterium]|nr:30S ribosomal protein S15 [Candidatus Wildermuthbacteria bacterium]